MTNDYIKLTTGELLTEVIDFLDWVRSITLEESNDFLIEDSKKLKEALIQRFPEYELDEH